MDHYEMPLQKDIDDFVAEYLPELGDEHHESEVNVRDPIWGNIRLSPWELEIVDTPLFCRLRWLHQTSLVFLVFRSCIHTRFQHSLGVLAAASRMLDSLRESTNKICISVSDRLTVRLAALLHDIGHTIFSHLGERQLAYHPWIIELRASDPKYVEPKTHELISALIVMSPSFRAFFDSIVSVHVNAEPALGSVSLDEVAGFMLGHANGNRCYLAEVINGPFDADKLDYILRDSPDTATMPQLDLELLFSNVAVVPTKGSTESHLALRFPAVSTYETLLLSKMLFATSVLDRYQVRAANSVFNKYFKFLRANEGNVPPDERFDRPTSFLRRTDAEWLREDRSMHELASLSDQLVEMNLPIRVLVLHPKTVATADGFERLQKMIVTPGYISYLEQRVLEVASAYLPGHTLTIRDIHVDLPSVPGLEKDAKAIVVSEDGQLVSVGDYVPVNDMRAAFAHSNWCGYVFVSTRDKMVQLRVAEATYQVLASQGVLVNDSAFIRAGINPAKVKMHSTPIAISGR